MNKYKVFLFGSQVEGTKRKSSDIDIGIEGTNPLDLSVIGNLEEDFDESDIAQTVDIVDFSKASEKFKSVAKKNIYYLN